MMPEGLSQEDNQKAEKFIEKNKASVDELKAIPEVYEEEQELLKAEGQDFRKVLDSAETTPVRVAARQGFQNAREKFNESYQRQTDKERQTENAKDANLWRAEQHKNEHLDEYKATAAGEAAERGIDVKYDTETDETKPAD